MSALLGREDRVVVGHLRVIDWPLVHRQQFGQQGLTSAVQSPAAMLSGLLRKVGIMSEVR